MTDAANRESPDVRAIAEMVVHLLAERGLVVYAGPGAAAHVLGQLIEVDDAAIGGLG
jgi:hypothetical protein